MLCVVAGSVFPTVATAQTDNQPPTLHSLSADPAVVSIHSGPAVAWFDATITDDISGVHHRNSPCGEICYPTMLEVFSPSRQRSGWQFVHHVSGDLYRMGIRFQTWDELGTWKIEYAQLTDLAGNIDELFADDLATLGLSATVEVTNEPPTEHAMSVSLSLAKHLIARGTAVPSDAAPECAISTVLIAKWSGTSWRTVSSTVTSESGAFRVQIPDRTGKYKAILRSVRTESGMDVCLPAESPVVRHRHR